MIYLFFRLASLLPTEEELRQLPENLNTDTSSTKKADSTEKVKENLQSTKTIFREEGDDEESEDFLSLSTKSTKFRVVHVAKDASKLNSHVAESVLNFRETMLYGKGSKNRREASDEVVRRKQKIQLIKATIKS
jgi:hypothetical protein